MKLNVYLSLLTIGQNGLKNQIMKILQFARWGKYVCMCILLLFFRW